MVARIKYLLYKVGSEYVATLRLNPHEVGIFRYAVRRVAAIFVLCGAFILVMIICFFVLVTLSSVVSKLF